MIMTVHDTVKHEVCDRLSLRTCVTIQCMLQLNYAWNTLPMQNLIEVFDNVLEETNVEGWQELQSVSHPPLSP